MKKLLVLLLTLVSMAAYSQNPLKFKASTAVGGATLDRGGTFVYTVFIDGNSNTTARQTLIDMQYDQTNFELVSVYMTGTGGNGGMVPYGSTVNTSWYNYPGYSFTTVSSGNSANNTTNGTNNYLYCQYAYNATGDNAILRTTVSWSTTNGMPYQGYGDFVRYTFRLKAASTAYTFNPIKLNFVAAWNGTGQLEPTLMESPVSTQVVMNQNFGKFVTAKVDLNSNLYNLTGLKVSFRDTTTNQGQLFPVLADGTVDINQSLLAASTVYDVTLMHEMDKTYAIYNGAITISDFSTAQNEFTSMGLTPGGKGVNLNTGQALYAADINKNKIIDGGDLPRLLGQVAGKDTLMTLPAGYTAGSGGWMSLPTWRAADATTTWGQVEWAYATPNAYSSGVSKLFIDLREYPAGTTPNQIKSIQLFDVYTGPIEYMGDEGGWATYKVPSNLSKASDGTSTYLSYIRSNSNDRMFRAEFEFNASVNNSWGAITTTNWSNITYPKTYFRTGTLGTNAILDLKYLLWGDVNRSHSSQVLITANGSSIVQTNAIPSLVTNSTFTNETAVKSMSSTGPYINTDFAYTSIDVNLANQTVTSNTIEIPVNIDTKGNSVGGLQLEFAYDPAKIKFEEMASNVPNSWFVFVNAKNGIVKFGALDQNNTTPIKGTNVPFKLKFSTIGDGVDILTSLKVSPTMDASDNKGNQLGVVLNLTNIKLTGYNNF